MERVLRGKEMAEIILLPVRHHSPACAWHVSRTIEKLRPSVILVEGPDNANSLIPMMAHEDTKAPFAIYYSYHDTTARISEEKEHYRCYYPFLDYSPELAALREGKRLEIATAFVDLPYGEILAASGEGKGLLKKDEEKNNYNDDYLLSRNEYLRQLCENTGLRSFDEFWEKYFELNGLREESEKWFMNLLTYCRLARENTSPESMEEDGCLARERFMADKILEYAKKPEAVRILAVTGGFHTPGLKKLLEQTGAKVYCGGLTEGKTPEEGSEPAGREEENLPEGREKGTLPEDKGRREEDLPEGREKGTVSKDKGRREGNLPEGREKGTLPEDIKAEGRGAASRPEGTGSAQKTAKIPEKDQGVYLMPYTMEAADALNGYASGMPFTGFYQRIWDGLTEGTAGDADRGNGFAPYKEAVLDMIVAAGKETRRKEGYLSTYDEICACAMAEGLAELRGKQEPGAYELLDAVMSSFVKGEYNAASDAPMRILRKHMTGNAVGMLCSQADVPPIVRDFEAKCRAFGWKLKSTQESEVTLSVFSNQKHRQESMFLNRMRFLKTAFARKIKGPDLQLKKDRNLIREIWKYKWSAQVNSALIDVSVYGATIEEAAVGMVKEELKNQLSAKESVVLLTHVFEMGLSEQMQTVYERVQEQMLTDTSFYSLAEAVKSLMMMEELGSLYGTRMEFGELIHMGCRKLIVLLPSMAGIKDEALTPTMSALKLLYQITGRKQEQYGQERDDYYETLEKMCRDSEMHSGLEGCIHGILYGSGRETAAETEKVCRGYLLGTKEQMLHTAQFFKGLFYTARDLVFIGDVFLKMLDEFYGRVSEDEFMELLPELRMAFGYFTPREIDRIAAGAAALHGKGGQDIMERKDIYPDWYSYGRELDEYIRANSQGEGGRSEDG